MSQYTVLGFMADPAIHSGGPRRYLAHMIMLADRGNCIVLLLNACIQNDDIFKHSGVEEHPNITLDFFCARTARPFCGWALFFHYAIVRQRVHIAQHCPDVIFVYGSCNILAVGALKNIFKCVCVFDPRDNPHVELRLIMAQERSWRMKGIYIVRILKEKYFEWRMKKTVDFYFFQTEIDAVSYRKRIAFGAQEYAVLANNVNGLTMHAREHNMHNSSVSLRHILFCGTLIPRKGIMLLVHAVHALAKEGVLLNLSIAGTGSEEGGIRAYIRAHDLKNITLLGWTDSCQKLMCTTDLLVVPSLYDALPDVLLEAFSTGIAVIGSDIAGIRTAIQDTRFLFHPGSVAAITAAIRYMHRDNTLFKAAQMHSCQRYAAYDFDWAECCMNRVAPIIETHG